MGQEMREGSLTHGEWTSLVRLWRDVGRMPRSDAEGGARELLLQLCGLMEASAAYLTLISRDMPVHMRSYRALGGWRPMYTVAMSADGLALDAIVEKFLRLGVHVDDPVMSSILICVGERRAYLPRRMLTGTSFRQTPLAARLRELGAHDRLFGVQPLGPNTEAVLYLDRGVGAPLFTSRERRLLIEVLSLVTPLLTCLARFAGCLDALEPLTPKERVVLRLLLTGRTEGEIAMELDMGQRSLHQRVVNVYRKFGVGSRPQLMALWLDGPPMTS